MNKQYWLVFNKLEEWILKNNYESYDICDIKGLPLFLTLSKISNQYKFGKYIEYPVFWIANKFTDRTRRIFRIKKKMYPQAQALIARAYFKVYKYSKEKIYLDKSFEILKWLLDNRVSSFKYYCWGQPYAWFSRKLIPANTPRTTVTSQVANAFLDAYEISNDAGYLDVANNICQFYVNELNHNVDDDNNICFSYTTLDNYNIHNASMLASSTLIRTWYHTKNEKFKDYGIRALNYTLKHQNTDGSWYYWGPPDKLNYIIDNYHTGFILESLYITKKYLGKEFNHDLAITKGLNYYIDNLFTKDYIPKLRHNQIFPVDIQSCAQSIITLGEMEEFNKALKEIKEKVVNWTINNMFDNEGYFYYRFLKNGKIDKTPYIRWSESWMLRALSFVLN
jgi:hypothetical protein